MIYVADRDGSRLVTKAHRCSIKRREMPLAVAGLYGDARTQEMLRDQIQMPIAIDVCEENTTRAVPDRDRRGGPGHEKLSLRVSPRAAANPGPRNQHDGELPHGFSFRVLLKIFHAASSGCTSRFFGLYSRFIARTVFAHDFGANIGHSWRIRLGRPG